jgi:hypothetical protein
MTVQNARVVFRQFATRNDACFFGAELATHKSEEAFEIGVHRIRSINTFGGTSDAFQARVAGEGTPTSRRGLARSPPT